MLMGCGEPMVEIPSNPRTSLQLSVSTSFKPGFPLPTTVANKALKNKCFRVDGLAFSLTLEDQGADGRKYMGRGAHNSKLDHVTRCDLANSRLPAPVLQLRRKTQALSMFSECHCFCKGAHRLGLRGQQMGRKVQP